MQDTGGVRKALITGASGQDGIYLSELLLRKGYHVVGTTRRPLEEVPEAGANSSIAWIQWDSADQAAIEQALTHLQPDECYNLAAQASGSAMYEEPASIGETNGIAVVRLLEAIRTKSPHTRFVQASSAEVFGAPESHPQSETTVRRPRSPYGAAKLYADAIVDVYRERYGLFAASAILYNHESPRRGMGFVSRKVSQAAAAISLGLADQVTLGNLDACRDWGFAGDYVNAMWLMLQAQDPEDFVIATGVSRSVADLCKVAFDRVGLDYRPFVIQEPALFRAIEPVPLVGCADKARRVLGWAPTVDFNEFVAMMVDCDVARLQGADSMNGAES